MMELSDKEIDFIVRRVIMASFLYYECAKSIVSDDQYDKWSVILSENWDRIDPFRQKQLGSAEEIQGSGSHIKHTALSIAGAMRWYESEVPGNHDWPDLNYTNWPFSEELGCHFYNTSV